MKKMLLIVIVLLCSLRCNTAVQSLVNANSSKSNDQKYAQEREGMEQEENKKRAEDRERRRKRAEQQRMAYNKKMKDDYLKKYPKPNSSCLLYYKSCQEGKEYACEKIKKDEYPCGYYTEQQYKDQIAFLKQQELEKKKLAAKKEAIALKTRTMPRRKMKNSTLEKMMMRAVIEGIKKTDRPVRAVILNSKWYYKRHDISGKIIKRKIDGAVGIRRKKGLCYYVIAEFAQDVLKNGKYGKLYVNEWWNRYDDRLKNIRCKNMYK